ncbi:Trehalase [Symbiodinium microadriaticum]|uniref:Trehalase n=2 Tax=Symbiodinium TaxID=2949 RepID=A0A1Q9ELW4_SYMMI|nr:Trehalase [Symbiodinium microadriaticum]
MMRHGRRVAVAPSLPEPVQRACSVFCEGELLDTIQRARLFEDSKTFVDRPLRVEPEEVLEAFRRLPDKQNAEALRNFVETHFEAEGQELEPFVPADHQPNPPQLARLPDEALRQWAMALHQIWKDLCRKQRPAVAAAAQRHSALPQRFASVVPGGRFRETYYWDTYWIVRGLLLSGMNDTAKGVVENLLDYVRQFGFVPNGGRVYYLDRSQPPMLGEMVQAVLEVTADDAWLREVFPVLEAEYKFWMDPALGHFLPDLGLNVFSSSGRTPRPESYSEDVATAEHGKKLGREPSEVLHELRSGAETGWDFSTRWLQRAASDAGSSDLATINASQVVPVDLNCILLRLEKRLAAFARHLGDKDRAAALEAAAERRSAAVDRLLWSDDLGSYRDLRLDTGKAAVLPSLSDFAAPLWAGLTGRRVEALLASLRGSGLLQAGGAATTTLNSGEQWDAPNAWAPLQLMLIEGLETLSETMGSEAPGSAELAEELASRWLRNCYEAWHKHGAMFEKYDAFHPGEGGGGGEYHPQTGFGWSNGVALVLLVKNADRAAPFVPTPRTILA